MGTLKTMAEAALKKHNDYRAQHKDTPPMVLCDELNKDAQAWADRGVFEHCKERNGAGENIAWNCGKSAEDAAAQAVDQWYNEIKDYNWSNAVFAMNTGHFTQVVWKSSTQLGIGVAPCEVTLKKMFCHERDKLHRQRTCPPM